MRTFWYLRLLGPPCQLKNVKCLICDLSKSNEFEGKRLTEPPVNQLTPSRHPKIHPYHHIYTLGISKCSPWHSQTSQTQNRHHWHPHFTQTPFWQPLTTQKIFKLSREYLREWRLFLGDRGMLNGCLKVIWGVQGCILGCLEGVSWFTGGSGGSLLAVSLQIH